MSVLDYKIRLASYMMFGFANTISLHATISRDLALSYEMNNGRYSLFVNIKTAALNPEYVQGLLRYTPVTYPYLAIWREFNVIPTTLYVPIAGLKTDYIGKEGGFYNLSNNDKIDYLFTRPNSYNESYITTVQSPDGKLQFNLVEWDNNVVSMCTYMGTGVKTANFVTFTTRTKDTEANYVPIVASVIISRMYGIVYAVAHQACSINYAANAIDCVSFRMDEQVYKKLKKYNYLAKVPLVTIDDFSLKMNLYPENEKLCKVYDPYYNIEAEVINYVVHNITNTYNPTTSYQEESREDLIDLDFPDFFDTNKDASVRKMDNIKEQKNENDNEEEKLEQDNRNNDGNKISPLSEVRIDAKVDKVMNTKSKAIEPDIDSARTSNEMVQNTIDKQTALLTQADIHKFAQDAIADTRPQAVLKQNEANISTVEKKSNPHSHQQSTTIANNLASTSGPRKPPFHAKTTQNFTPSN